MFRIKKSCWYMVMFHHAYLISQLLFKKTLVINLEESADIPSHVEVSFHWSTFFSFLSISKCYHEAQALTAIMLDFCLFVLSFSSHSRKLHSFGDDTFAGEGLQILTYARHYLFGICLQLCIWYGMIILGTFCRVLHYIM